MISTFIFILLVLSYSFISYFFVDIREQISVKERSESTVGGVWVRGKDIKKLSIRTDFQTVKSIKKSLKAFYNRLNSYKTTLLHFSLCWV